MIRIEMREITTIQVTIIIAIIYAGSETFNVKESVFPSYVVTVMIVCPGFFAIMVPYSSMLAMFLLLDDHVICL